MLYFLKKLGILIILALPHNGLYSQTFVPEQTERTDREKKLEKAITYLSRFIIDSTEIILDDLHEALTQTNELDTPMGLKVRYYRSEMNIHLPKRRSEVMKELLEVIELAKQLKQWNVLAQSHIH